MENLAVGQVPPDNNMNPENQLSNLPPQSLPTQNLPLQNLPLDMNTLTLLLGILQQVSQGKNTSELEELINSMEQLLEEK